MKVLTYYPQSTHRRHGEGVGSVTIKVSASFEMCIRDRYTEGHRIRWDRLEDHQRDFLDAWDAAGGISFVLAGFTLRQLYVVPWEWWRRGYEKRQAGKGMASFTVRDLRPEWLVTVGRIPLDYLAVLDREEERDGEKEKRPETA